MNDDRGLLGGLPTNRRPGVESPHRVAARERAEASTAAKSSAEPESGPPAPHSEQPALEQLARAGVGLAAATVSTGMKIAGAALGRIAGRG